MTRTVLPPWLQVLVACAAIGGLVPSAGDCRPTVTRGRSRAGIRILRAQAASGVQALGSSSCKSAASASTTMFRGWRRGPNRGTCCVTGSSRRRDQQPAGLRLALCHAAPRLSPRLGCRSGWRLAVWWCRPGWRGQRGTIAPDLSAFGEVVRQRPPARRSAPPRTSARRSAGRRPAPLSTPGRSRAALTPQERSGKVQFGRRFLPAGAPAGAPRLPTSGISGPSRDPRLPSQRTRTDPRAAWRAFSSRH